uniref:Uncharacterized protein n=1 Tax=Anguilla anguilla TaxID=7936 RepID=A0A0E9VHI3_ANGAN
MLRCLGSSEVFFLSVVLTFSQLARFLMLLVD